MVQQERASCTSGTSSTNDETSWCVSWSISRSFISKLVGVAMDQGLIDISKKITHYVPELRGIKTPQSSRYSR